MLKIPTLDSLVLATRAHGRVFRFSAIAFSIGVAALVAAYGFGGDTEKSFQSVRDGINSKSASGQIVLVEMDAKSLHALNTWPWPRRYHGAVVDRLNEAGAVQIAFDVDFSASSNPADDASFAEAINRAGGKVILPTFRQPAASGNVTDEIENLPIEILRNQAFLGSVNVHPDSDGQINAYPFGTITEGYPRPSIGALLADASGPVDQSFPLDHSIELETIPRLSFIDVLNGNFDPYAVAGRRVIIGATAIEMGDRYATARFGVVPGVVIQILAAETLLAGTALPSLGGLPLLVFVVIAVILQVALSSGQRLMNMTLAAALAAAVFLIPVLTERLKIASLDVLPAFVLIGLCVASQYLIEFCVEYARERSVDRETGLPNLSAWNCQTSVDAEAVVIVAENTNFGEILSTLNEADSKEYLTTLAKRLELGCGPGALHRIGRQIFCWKPATCDAEAITSQIEGVAHFFIAPILIGERSVRASLSFGVARGNFSDPGRLSNLASVAAKRATESGAKLLWHSDHLAASTDRALFIVSEFETALKDGQISVVYQPKLDVKKGQVTSAEALVRWRHPVRGNISPAEFVGELERHKLAAPLTLFVVESALNAVRSWAASGVRMGCAINLSASLFDKVRFFDDLKSMLHASGVDPQQVTFELTESAVLSNTELGSAMLAQLAELGCPISIDDYGTGQSTLTYLKDFSATEIKIDQSFVKLVAANAANRIMVRSTIEMAHELGLKVVAEGVETEDIMRELINLGCDTLQGWHIGHPVPETEYAAKWCSPEDAGQAPNARAG